MGFDCFVVEELGDKKLRASSFFVNEEREIKTNSLGGSLLIFSVWSFGGLKKNSYNRCFCKVILF